MTTATYAAETAPEILDAFQFECDKQKRLFEELTAEGYTMVDDPSGLSQDIGSVQEVECFCEV